MAQTEQVADFVGGDRLQVEAARLPAGATDQGNAALKKTSASSSVPLATSMV